MWRFIPPILIPVDAVVPTQQVYGHVSDRHIVGPSVSGDPYAHVVVCDGRWLIEDGHHRYRAAQQAGELFFPARVLVMTRDQLPEDWCCRVSGCVQTDAV